MRNTPRASLTRPPARAAHARALTLALLCVVVPHAGAQAQARGGAQRRSTPQAARPATDVRVGSSVGVSAETLSRIVRAEDERRWDETELGALLGAKSAAVRRRAALAAGRIGDERAVEVLGSLLRTDVDESVRVTAAFALGEIESEAASELLLTSLRVSKSASERARAVEALGKIAAALPSAQEERRKVLGEAILSALETEQRAARPNKLLVQLGLTAVLRARPAQAGPKVASFLSHGDARVRADALNTLARLRAKESLDRVASLFSSDPDAAVRANAARVIGAAEDTLRLDLLTVRGLSDPDQRVRVSAIRALAQLQQQRAVAPLLRRAEALFASYIPAKTMRDAHPPETSELLEIATTLGRLLANKNDRPTLAWLRQFREAEGYGVPEVEIAMARIAPTEYLREPPFPSLSGPDAGARNPLKSWQSYAAIAQGLGEIAAASSETGGNTVVSLKADAQILLLTLAGERSTPALAIPDVLRALAAFKPASLSETMRARLSSDDVFVRATAADIIADLNPEPANSRVLASALARSLSDPVNDAALSILAALAKQRSAEATDAIRTARASSDYIVRRRAAALLKELSAGGTAAVETVATRNTEADYQRSLARIGKSVRARVETDKGAFTIELLPAEAPLNVDNFVGLARRGYFDGVVFHRVVPNFVVQGGDPRGDGNGGPGYQIRCEINAVQYERGAVGMALSGKDTGGSQWFVTHSPQPHLDGGYTVFGRVVEGMDVVDAIVRGDRIRAITITEGKPPAEGKPRPAGPRR